MPAAKHPPTGSAAPTTAASNVAKMPLAANANSVSADGASASQLIDKKIAALGDWRGDTLRRMRKLIKAVDPDIEEAWKWMGTPVWSHHGIICTGESYRSIVKLTFANGALLADPSSLFNSSLDGKVRRAIDIHEREAVDADAFRALIRTAIAFNASAKAPRQKGPR